MVYVSLCQSLVPPDYFSLAIGAFNMRSNVVTLPHFIAGAVVIIGLLLSPCRATVDLSNVDLQNFRYFKYPQQSQRLVQPIAGRNPAAAAPPLQIPARLMRQSDGQKAPLIVVRTIVRPEPQRQTLEAGGSAGPLAKVSAVFGYVGRVLFGNLPNEPEVPVKFHPDAAYRMREQYQRQFGFRGERLIEQLGQGQRG